jgi:hypothetical protein
MTKVDDYLASLPDWQQKNLELFRSAVHEVDESITEDFKWGVPVFMHGGKMYFAMSAFKHHTKYNFMQNGAHLEDSEKLFNNGFDSKKHRGIDLFEGEALDRDALKRLIATSLFRSDN